MRWPDPSRTAGRLADRVPRWVFSLVVAPLLALLALSAWALSSPVGSSPDDDFHLVSIWCGAGIRADICEPGTSADSRRVPTDVRTAAACYSYNPGQSAGCQRPDFGTPDGKTVTTRRGNFTGLYPPLFYLTMSTLVGPNVDMSVIAMRILNSFLLVGLATLCWRLLPRGRRSTLLWSLILTSVPLFVFIVPSTNPSSWAVTAIPILWISLLGYFETTGRRRIGLGAIAAVTTVMAGQSRSDAAVYAIIGILIACWLAFRRDRVFALSAILPAVLVVVSIVFYRLASQGGSALGGLSGHPPPSATISTQLFLLNVSEVPDLWVGVFGRWKLGWLDTEVPPSVWVIGFGLAAGAIALHLSTRTRRVGWPMIGVLAVLIVLPCFVLTQTGAHVGGYVQPRYLLPLITLFMGLSILGPLARTGPQTVRRWQSLGISLGRPAYVLAVLGLAVANCLALRAEIRRYVTGTNVDGFNLSSDAQWWWPAAPSPMAVWIVGTVAFGLFLLVAAMPRLFRASRAYEAKVRRPVPSG